MLFVKTVNIIMTKLQIIGINKYMYYNFVIYTKALSSLNVVLNTEVLCIFFNMLADEEYRKVDIYVSIIMHYHKVAFQSVYYKNFKTFFNLRTIGKFSNILYL